MRREILQPDAEGRVALASLGLRGEVVAEEVEPGRWLLTAHTDTPAEGDDEMAFGGGPTEPTVSYGTSSSRVERPAGMPPPGRRRRADDAGGS